ncbi:MAG: rhomboid family intramembrane serine protease [Elusimicrobia bacterium]|nr:rhomboid family intramembrane serine protease [Elusimicrobiota bacterium]
MAEDAPLGEGLVTRGYGHSPLSFQSMSPAIRALLITNIAAFCLSWFVGAQMVDLFGLVPRHFWHNRWVWQCVSYLFIHGSFMHLLINVFCLWMFALPVEAQWGSRDFLKYYFLCGVGSGLISAAIHPASGVPIVGASGAIYGLLVAFAMLNPDAVVYLYFFFPLKARDMAILVGFLEFFAGASSSSPGIARFTHLSGMVLGYLTIRWWWVAKLRIKGWWRRRMGRDFEGEDEPPAFRPARRVRSGSVAEGGADRAAESLDEVDRILDKISAQGKESLSPAELELLRRAARKQRGSGQEPEREGHA